MAEGYLEIKPYFFFFSLFLNRIENRRQRLREREKKGIYIGRGGLLISVLGLANNLKRTTAATAITRGITHFIQDEPPSSRACGVIPLGLIVTGRD